MLTEDSGNLGVLYTHSLLRQKLAQEYILNLPLLFQVPSIDRAEAKSAFCSSKHLLDGAAGIYAIVAKAIMLLGIPTSAALLYCAKSIKRFIRRIKTSRFAEEENA